MTSLLDDIHTSAKWIARALNSSGYKADFTPESLRDIERFMDEHSNHGVAVAHGLLATARAKTVRPGCLCRRDRPTTPRRRMGRG